MNEDEKEAIFEIEKLTAEIYTYMGIEKVRFYHDKYKIILNLIEKQQKQIAEQKERLDGRYYHSVKLRELEIAIEEDWRNKIIKLKEKVEKERISNPYDFSYMLEELLGE